LAPGTTVPRTADNPNGYAITTQTITEHEVVTENRNQQLWGDDSGSDFSVSGEGSSIGAGTATLDSTSTVTVNVAEGFDTQTGGFSGSDDVIQSANYNQKGWATGTYFKENWTYQYQEAQTSSNSVNGQYGGEETAATDQGDAYTRTYTVTISTLTPGIDTWTPPQTSTGTAAFSSTGGSSDEEEAPSAPEDPSAGGAPAAVPATIPPYDLSALSSEEASVVGQFFKGAGQGVLNTLNGVQDIGIGLANLSLDTGPIGFVKDIAEQATGVNLDIPSPDWSRGKITHESDFVHNASKIIGGNAAVIMPWTKLPAVVGSWAGAAKGAIIGRSAVAAEAIEVAAAESTVATRGAAEAESLLGWCFPAGTLVSTADGLLPIEEVKPGSNVWAYDLIASAWKICKVLKAFRREYVGHSTFVT
jgi:hypothetical protein